MESSWSGDRDPLTADISQENMPLSGRQRRLMGNWPALKGWFMICIVMSCPSVRGTRERSADLIEYFFFEQHWVRERLKHYFQVRSILWWENCSHWIMIKTVWDSSADGSFDIRHVGRWRDLALLVSVRWRVGKYRQGFSSQVVSTGWNPAFPVILFLRESMAFLVFQTSYWYSKQSMNASWNLRIRGCFIPWWCQMHDFSSYKMIKVH